MNVATTWPGVHTCGLVRAGSSCDKRPTRCDDEKIVGPALGLLDLCTIAARGCCVRGSSARDLSDGLERLDTAVLR